MFRHYIKTAIRNTWKNKAFSFLNIFGLALGITCSILITLWVKDEYNIDAFHNRNTSIYNLYEREYADNKVTADYETPVPLWEEIKKTIPEIQYATFSDWNDNYTFRVGDKITKEKGGYASEDFFRIFSFPFLQGDPATALTAPNSIAISKKVATTLFGSPHAAIGHAIRCNDKTNLTVSAVFDNIPAGSSLQFDYMANAHTFYEEFPWMNKWLNSGPLTTILLKPGADPGQVQEKIKNILNHLAENQAPGHRVEFGMQRFDQRYLHGNFKNGSISGGRIEYVHLFTIVAIFILIIACINFMNLATARSIKRAKEIGVRKVIGASRPALIGQFLGESILLSFAAVGLATLLVNDLLPLFNSITTKQIVLPTTQPTFWAQLIALALLIGTLSGIYPAFYLSSFNPAKVLKGAVKFGTGATIFRKSLVVVQFTLSILLIIGTLIISRQVHYIQTKNIGYNRDNLLYIPLEGTLTSQYQRFKNEAIKMPGISQVSRIGSAPNNIDNQSIAIEWPGKSPDNKPAFSHSSIGYDFIKTMKAQLTLGRDFSPTFASDSLNYILNEAAVQKIGYKNPIGSSLTFWGRKGTVIGVIKNFHFASLHDEINPLVLRLTEADNSGYILVRTTAGQTSQAIATLRLLNKQLNPAFPFNYQFADEEYYKKYKSEEVTGKLSNYFAFLAIFISCLGLLGLAMFTAEQRTKEIGIRKILGASVAQLFTLLSREFLALVLIALLIATPAAWWAMTGWLQNYAYHTSIPIWIFAVAGSLALLIALATISFQALKVSLASPIKSLKKE